MKRKLHPRGFHALLSSFMLATVPLASALADVEQVPGLNNSVSFPALSDDGQWMAWAERGVSATTGDLEANLYLQNLSNNVQIKRSLRSTTNDADIDFANNVYPSVSADGSRIAIVADTPESTRRYEALVVLDDSGAELVRVTGFDSISLSDMSLFEGQAFIDSTGSYVAFTTDATVLSSDRGYSSSDPGTSPCSGADKKCIAVDGDDYENVFLLEVATGDITWVSNVNESESEGYSYAQAISSNGQYVLFSSDSSLFPDSNGDDQLYRATTGSGAIVHISKDESDATLSDLSCGGTCTTIDMSNDGSRVIFSESNIWDHSYLWEEGVGTTVITATDYLEDRAISGSGKWLVSGFESFSRLNLNNLSIETIAETIEQPRINGDGSVVLFYNDLPSSYPGQWWLLFNEPEVDLVPINLTVSEVIHVLDGFQVEPAPVITVNEVIVVNDASEIKSVPPALPSPELILPGPLEPNVSFIATGDSFMPHTLVEAFLYSVPIKVGEQYADPVGNVRFEITIPPGFPPGAHRVVLQGTGLDGLPREISENITTTLADLIFMHSFD